MTNSNSTPPRASFASALAQKLAGSSKSDSPVKSTTNFNSTESPIVKLPTQSTSSNNQSTTPAVTIDGSNPAQSINSVKVAPIKFGSFAAVAAHDTAFSPSANATPNFSNSNTSGNGPTLPPRTQSAPPSVVDASPAFVIALNETASTLNALEPAVILPAIQEDSHHQPQAHVSFNYEQQQQQQQQHYQPRPRYYNPQYQQHQYQNQRYHNPQHQFSHPQQHQHQQYYPNPNYRPHLNPNYRPRPQYQPEGYYQPHPGMAAQGSFYPPQTGFYRPPQGHDASSFQRPAPTFNNYVRPVVAPSFPANLPGFVHGAASVTVEASNVAPAVALTSPGPVDASTASVVTPIVVKPAPSKIKIVDPNTGKELNFGSGKPELVPETQAEIKPVELVQLKPVAPVKAAEEPLIVTSKSVIQPASVNPVIELVKPVPVTSVKKISIVIKDPNSNKELNLDQVISRPANIKDDLAVEELTAAFSHSTKLDEISCPSPVPVSQSPLPTAGFEHDKTILANLNVDDDDVSEDEDDYSDYSSDEEEEIFIPSTVQYNQSISYPETCIPFVAPSNETGVWLYSRDFMLQFKDKCITTPGDLQERLSVAVEKAKAFASSERLNGDRSHRREGHREDRKKRRHNNNGALGPQAHLLDMNAVLKNRAENAWAPVRSAEELSQVDRIIREVKGLLNKLTLEKFHVISDKILSLGIMSSDVLSGVIDCVFDKSVSEPRFAPMYAELCYKIVVEELNGLKKTLPANTAPDSQFRRLLVERCQAEYKHKRAWSKKRLEKLLETTEKSTDGSEESSNAAELSDMPKANVGELTEEDYLLIKLKRRVLGNMRFIGEIFKVGLIGEKIMHSIITELLSNVENPEEEEIECLCRLLMTVGSILDKPEAVNFWNQYIGRMNWLISQPGKLSSRIKFMIMDVIELRDKKWKSGKAEEGPKTIAQIQKEQQNKERNDRDRDREYRDRSDRDRDRNRHQQQQHQQQHGSAPALKFTSGSGKQKTDEWNRSGTPKGGSTAQLSRGPSVRRPPTPSQPSPVTPNPAEISSSSLIGRFDVLNTENEASSSEKHEEIVIDFVSDEERVKKIVSLLDELVQMNNFDDIYEELKLCVSKSSALSGLLNRAIEGGKKAALLAVIRVFSECPQLSHSDKLEAFKLSFGMIDDLAVDVPSVYEIAGQLYSALSLSLTEIFETLSDCPDDSAKTRVILQTIANSSNQEHKEALRQNAKEFVEKNKKPVIENLMKKLNIEI